MFKLKNLISVITLVVLLAASLFILTGCSDDEEVESTEAGGTEVVTTEDTTTATTITVPMTVVNMYPDTIITELYISGAGLDTWGEDMLGDEVMPTGTQLSLDFVIDQNNVEWDIKAVDEEGTPVEFRNLDLSNVSTTGGTITLEAEDDGTPVAIAE